VHAKVMRMYTDPTRIHATAPGHIESNPVFVYHNIFNSDKDEVAELKQRYRQHVRAAARRTGTAKWRCRLA